MQENINIPDSNITTNLSFRQLVLMNMQQLTNFPYIEKDFDALTDYELLCLVVKFLNDVISNQNEQNASITRMYESFLSLQTYVNNTKDTLEDAFNNLDNYVRYYFDNLDVQDEINNKLDEMLEDGVLEQIIEQFIQSTAIWCFDTVADMKSATNLINGSYARTLGYYSVNDGGGATYKVTNTASLNDLQETLNSGLYATLIIENNTIKAEQIGIQGNVVDNSNCNTLMQKLINYASSNDYYIEFMNKTYNCYSINIPANTKIIGNGATFKKPNFKIEPYNLQPNVYGHYELFTFISPNSNDEPLPIYISDCIFDGNCWEIWSIEEGFSQQQGSLITIFGNANYTSRIHAKFYNVTVQNSASDGFHIRDNADVYIENAVSNECFRGGLTCTGGGSLVKVNGFEFNGNLVPDGIDLETDSGNTALNEYFFSNITINNDLDLGIPSNNTLIVIDNMISKGTCDIKGTLKGTYISNSYFSISDPTKNFIFSSSGSEYKTLTFTNCIFEGAKNENENTGTSINMLQSY